MEQANTDAARTALRGGNLLLAYDICAREIAAGDPGRKLRYLLVLTLARMGETKRALGFFEANGLAEDDDVDVAALQGRLLKDLAGIADVDARPAAFARASDVYLDAHRRFGGYFTLINAASLAHLAGSVEHAAGLAQAVLTDPEIDAATSYFAAASAVEALLLLDRFDDADAALGVAVACPDADAGARASTVRQFALLADSAPAASAQRIAAMIERLRPAPVAMFCGHMLVEDPIAEARIGAAIETELDASGTTIGYGALACGADILCAETLLRRGGELHVVLPFAVADFIEQSVAPGGPGWLGRFDTALAAATSVSFATEASYIGDVAQFGYGASFAMGLTCLRARHLETSPLQLAIWDGAAARGAAGTGIDVAAWQKHGFETRVIEPGSIQRPAHAAAPDAMSSAPREFRSIVFTDFAGFSKVTEHALPIFWSEVMGRVAAALGANPDAVRFRNTWGDALFAVIDEPVAAAEIALDMLRRLASFDPAILGLGRNAGMRVGLHHGPVYLIPDPITGKDNYLGTEVTRTARIEPVTPVGQVYVTQPFAALLALTGDARFATAYVGKIVLAKGYGEMTMYRLTEC